MTVYQNLPTALADGDPSTPSRTGKYGEAYVAPISNKEFYSAAEGSYFAAFTPTSGTGIIGHAAPTTFDETKPYLALYNSSATKSIYPQFITFNETVASVGGTAMRFVPVIDNGVRRASAGTALTVTNCNGASTIATAVTSAFCGAVVAAAATGAVKQYPDIVFRGTTIDIIGDNYTIVFGATSSNGGATSKVATLLDSSRVVHPLVVGPLQSFLLYQWAASQSTGPTFQVSMGWIER